MVCAKCNQEFANAKEVLKCSQCGLEFHISCCRTKPGTKVTRTSAKWRCDDCATEAASLDSRSDTEDSTVLDLLKSIKKEMSDSRKANKNSFLALEKSMASVKESLEEVKNKLSAVEAENISLKEDCVALKKENIALANKVYDLQCDMHDIQQYSRNNNLEIKGVPKTTREDIYTVLNAVANAIGVAYSRQDISVAHRLPAPRDRRYQPSIVVQFVSRSTRSEWVAAARKKRIQTTDLAASLAPAPVFINDHLTAYNKALLGRAKSMVKRGRLAFAWSKDGKILVRKTADSEARRVWTLDDVEKEASPGGVNSSVAEGTPGTPT